MWPSTCASSVETRFKELIHRYPPTLASTSNTTKITSFRAELLGGGGITRGGAGVAAPSSLSCSTMVVSILSSFLGRFLTVAVQSAAPSRSRFSQPLPHGRGSVSRFLTVAVQSATRWQWLYFAYSDSICPVACARSARAWL